MHNSNPTTHPGSCHCGAVRFTALVDAGHATRCNCRVCTKISGTTAIIKPEAFTLLSDPAGLSEYGNPVGTRFFCPRCGVHCFSRGNLPELGGDFVSVAINCLDDIDLGEVQVLYWDGRNDNWQAGPRPTPWPQKPATA